MPDQWIEAVRWGTQQGIFTVGGITSEDRSGRIGNLLNGTLPHDGSGGGLMGGLLAGSGSGGTDDLSHPRGDIPPSSPPAPLVDLPGGSTPWERCVRLVGQLGNHLEEICSANPR